MPEPMLGESKLVPQTDPLAKGTSTSEGKQNAGIIIGGVVIAAITAIASQLEATAPESKWAAAIISVAAILGTIWKALGYEKARTVVKIEKVRTDAVIAAATGSSSPNPQTPPSL